LNIAGGAPTAVTPDGVACGPSSPDGQFVIGVGPDSKVAIYPIGKGSARPIPGSEAGFVPAQWASDGATLYGYHRGELPSRVYKLEIATGKQTMVQELRPGVPAGVVNVAPVVVSRDGTRFAYSYNQTLSVLYIISGLQ